MIFCLVLIYVVNFFAETNEADEVNKIIKRQQQSYQQALSLIKKSYQILAELNEELFINSKDFDCAFQYFELKKYQKCIPIFISLIKRNECKLESMYFLAESFLAQKKIDRACVYYNMIVTSKQEYINEKVIRILKNSYLRLIKCFFILERNKDAQKIIENFLKSFPDEFENNELKHLCQNKNCMILLNLDSENKNLNDSENLEDSEQEDINCVVKLKK